MTWNILDRFEGSWLQLVSAQPGYLGWVPLKLRLVLHTSCALRVLGPSWLSCQGRRTGMAIPTELEPWGALLLRFLCFLEVSPPVLWYKVLAYGVVEQVSMSRIMQNYSSMNRPQSHSTLGCSVSLFLLYATIAWLKKVIRVVKIRCSPLRSPCCLLVHLVRAKQLLWSALGRSEPETMNGLHEHIMIVFFCKPMVPPMWRGIVTTKMAWFPLPWAFHSSSQHTRDRNYKSRSQSQNRAHSEARAIFGRTMAAGKC